MGGLPPILFLTQCALCFCFSLRQRGGWDLSQPSSPLSRPGTRKTSSGMRQLRSTECNKALATGRPVAPAHCPPLTPPRKRKHSARYLLPLAPVGAPTPVAPTEDDRYTKAAHPHVKESSLSTLAAAARAAAQRRPSLTPGTLMRAADFRPDPAARMRATSAANTSASARERARSSLAALSSLTRSA